MRLFSSFQQLAVYTDRLKSSQGETGMDKVLKSRVLVTETLYHSYEVTHIVVVVST